MLAYKPILEDGAVRKDTEDRRSLVNIEKKLRKFSHDPDILRAEFCARDPYRAHVPSASFFSFFLFFSFFFLSSEPLFHFTVELANFLSTTRKSHKRAERQRERESHELVIHVRSYIYREEKREREKKRRTSKRGATKLKEV